jgi:2-polyprenyl-3-methyl-5-hydroxy-6-metoxy-1,4-benzoquinol methylase
MKTKYKTDNDDWNEHWKNVNFLAKYNPGQILRHRLVVNTVDDLKIKRGWVLIDFGSGQGDMIKRLSGKFAELKMIGLEYSEFGVEFSKKNNQSAEFLVADLTSPNLSSSVQLKAKIITCCDVMEHIDNPETVVKNAYAMLNIGGTFIVTLPGGPMSILDKHIGQTLF